MRFFKALAGLACLSFWATPALAQTQTIPRFPILNQPAEEAEAETLIEIPQFMSSAERQEAREEAARQEAEAWATAYHVWHQQYPCLIDYLSLEQGHLYIGCSPEMGAFQTAFKFSIVYGTDSNHPDYEVNRAFADHIFRLYDIANDISDDDRVIFRVLLKPVEGQVQYPLIRVDLNFDDYSGEP